MKVFITLRPYLAQWLRHEHGGARTIHLRRGSPERDILEHGLRPAPRSKNFIPQMKPLPGQVAIEVTCFKYKDIRIFNYLPPHMTAALVACIRNSFHVQLWRELFWVGTDERRSDISITDWMKAHGIELNETNFNTIAKILQRKRAFYCPKKRLTDNKSSRHRKKST